MNLRTCDINPPRMYKDVVTWSPIVGCLYDCPYCVPTFQATVKRVYYCQGKKCIHCLNYYPHVHLDRLNRLPAGKTVWCCAHGDITFGLPEMVKMVIKKTLDYPDREFYWQSKNPKCLNKYLGDFPENTILLTTIETNRDQQYRKIIKKVPLPSKRFMDFKNLDWPRKILTIEPIMDFDPIVFFKWVKSINPEAIWIGYNSRRNSKWQLPEPPMEKTLSFIDRMRDAGFDVREKHMTI